jgi:hypothetical protein
MIDAYCAPQPGPLAGATQSFLRLTDFPNLTRTQYPDAGTHVGIFSRRRTAPPAYHPISPE